MKTLQRIGRTINKYYATFLGTIVLIIFISLLFFAFFPFQVAEFKKISITGTVQVGGILEYTNDYCQNVNKGVPRELSRYLVPKDTTLISPVQLSGNPTDETLNDAGCRISQPIKLPIDSSIPAGEYKLLVKVKYCVFPGRCIPVQGESEYFVITKPDVATQLQIIKDQLDSINETLNINSDANISNTQPVRPVPIPTQPMTELVVPQPAVTPTPQPVQERTQPLLRGTIDNTTGVLKNITNMLGL